ncbi:UNKNOWN [Stylonychia lemnae]|uniref:Knr4/Smi1-like domain-containing protein n=1 Tax=Stylonychia lemnae TaxID=5949 RepID=A0A078AC72_STYLE|nr:UNKNOWN [Stylonychia lemnae]|eukprot:CDW78373.1 UNKNOWN [Stylonychia lemnae]
MNKQCIREIFDDISFSVISFLENHIGVTDVEFIERQGVAEMSIQKWEEENSPYLLPDDYKAFLQISDGLSLNWKIKKNDQIFPLGSMHLNKLRDIKRLKMDRFKFSSVGEEEETSDEEPSEEQKDIAAFDIDSKVKDGRLALIYRGNTNKPQIWFQDLSCSWFFIAYKFTDYFRLMIMHLGLPHWQYAFTQVGLDPQALQWLRFLSPERLAIDIENRKNQENLAKKKHNKGAGKIGGSSGTEKIKVEGLRRKKRRMKLKAKGDNDAIIEKFSAQSSKSAKYAKTTIKKREASEIKQGEKKGDETGITSSI